MSGKRARERALARGVDHDALLGQVKAGLADGTLRAGALRDFLATSRAETTSATAAKAADGGTSPSAKRAKKQRPFDMSRYNQRYIALRVLYFGENLRGFASLGPEPDIETVEGLLLRALLQTRLISDRKTCALSRSGRTDKGVSAFAQVVALRVRSKSSVGVSPGDPAPPRQPAPLVPTPALNSPSFPPPPPGPQEALPAPEDELDYIYNLNRELPDEVRVTGWADVPAAFSARYSTAYRVYRYFFVRRGMDMEVREAGARRGGPERWQGRASGGVGSQGAPAGTRRGAPKPRRARLSALPCRCRGVWEPLRSPPVGFPWRTRCGPSLAFHFLPGPRFLPHPPAQGMAAAASALEGTHDFRNLCKMDTDNVSNYRRTVIKATVRRAAGSEAPWLEPESPAGAASAAAAPAARRVAEDETGSLRRLAQRHEVWYVELVGHAFLWHQVRCIAAVLFLVGRRLEEPGIVARLLDVGSSDEPAAGAAAASSSSLSSSSSSSSSSGGRGRRILAQALGGRHLRGRQGWSLLPHGP